MCGCIEEIDAKLKPDEQCLNASLFGPRRVAVDLIRTDKWVMENRRNKPKLMIATFCPFCGEQYPVAQHNETADVAIGGEAA
jgi:hypothetical protein